MIQHGVSDDFRSVFASLLRLSFRALCVGLFDLLLLGVLNKLVIFELGSAIEGIDVSSTSSSSINPCDTYELYDDACSISNH